jgi:hypothetical protein
MTFNEQIEMALQDSLASIPCDVGGNASKTLDVSVH